MIDISLFSNHSPSEWFSIYKKMRRPRVPLSRTAGTAHSISAARHSDGIGLEGGEQDAATAVRAGQDVAAVVAVTPGNRLDIRVTAPALYFLQLLPEIFFAWGLVFFV